MSPDYYGRLAAFEAEKAEPEAVYEVLELAVRLLAVHTPKAAEALVDSLRHAPRRKVA